ncbi:nucleotidyltransferase-like protein [Paenibacillus sp. UNC451MF]|uniref:nucleotidyltransferase-like protein n=1 Tax=Paenibacillus sp. UNC451MF TaxID=1449063 RepID=UPI00048EAEC2|nr:nucleotidyltransferase-like protein [Paenibacillus sp. UNC451MF]
MNALKEQRIARLREDEAVMSILAVDNPSMFSAITDGFDLLLLVIVKEGLQTDQQYHYIKDDCRIQERWFGPSAIQQLILHGEHRNLIYWILKGEILLDRNMYLEGLRHRMLEFPSDMREHKLLIEFSKFLRKYMESKEYILEDHLLDAYNNILEALHHWARIVIIEAGSHPEITVWRQVKTINPGVYKLYEELTLSNETLKQRVQLVLLASEFSVMSKMERCCRLLISVLSSREDAWSLSELQQCEKLTDVRFELPIILSKLVKKSLAKEVIYTLDEQLSLLEIRYTTN